LREANEAQGIRNVILMKFRVRPPGIENVEKVVFDVTRQRQSVVKDLFKGTPRTFKLANFPFDEGRSEETANDELVPTKGFEDDESIAPSRTKGDERAMYSMDAPGEDTLKAPAPSDVDTRIMQANFLEFVRVRFDGRKTLEGNGDLGTRCSNKFEWHSRMRLINREGTWQRDGPVDRETNTNDIGPKHEKLITKEDP
jgi:hypothetical protein